MVSSTTVLEFTDAATSKLLEVLEEQDAKDQYLRIAVITAPHGGIDYQFGLEEAPQDSDKVIDGAVKVLIDDESAPLLEGSSIDYVEGFERTGGSWRPEVAAIRTGPIARLTFGRGRARRTPRGGRDVVLPSRPGRTRGTV